MQLKSIALAAILGLSNPTMIELTTPHQAVAATFNYPEGEFIDRNWSVTLSFSNNAYYYYGQNRSSGSNITLAGARASGNKQRQIYTWNNNGTRYQVTWRPSDPNFIRVQVIGPNGRVLLNRLLRSAPN
ncbi:hypothetical protein B6N60_04395 [Richelia sinica FACHB-800]|uniref:Uncharacterized protein n=1 Tax=Richelia sinica FACHB-800 TaxID=1357546 RepID=A0A975TBH8_9NOST|nr:hypothetical protein [Richelia sinica]MBD2665465.1 hypothetical protein [Richelia sinica FACHB-800]QXE25675.1 hypothetical protein B6N60_04395 [Richelia sinica FACHB-800]